MDSNNKIGYAILEIELAFSFFKPTNTITNSRVNTSKSD